MRRASIILGVLMVVLGLAAAAEAGRYHKQATLNCAECHIMHATQKHGLGGETGAPYPISINTGTGVANLLRGDTTNALCLSCHDAKTAYPDVFESDINATANDAQYGRSAGALNQETGGTYANWKGHSLGYSGTAPQGTFSTTGLKCTNCHEQHGNSNYRNLSSKTDAGAGQGTTTVTDLLSTAPASGTANVRINVAAYTAPQATAANRAPYYGAYAVNGTWTGGTFYYEPDNNYTGYCANCHTSVTIGNKHPSNSGNDVTGLSPNNYAESANWRTKAKVKVTATDYTAWDSTGPTGASPFCGTCHKAHGNDNAFGLIFMDRALLNTAVTEQGTASGTETNLCSQCHGQAN